MELVHVPYRQRLWVLDIQYTVYHTCQTTVCCTAVAVIRTVRSQAYAWLEGRKKYYFDSS
jgi:hypothetical protein